MSNLLPALPTYVNKGSVQLVDVSKCTVEGSSTLPTRNVEGSVSGNAISVRAIISEKDRSDTVALLLKLSRFDYFATLERR